MDQIIYKKRIILILSFILVALTTLILTKYRTNLYEVNKEYLQKIAYEEAKNHFENLKIFRFWNGLNSGVYVKSNDSFEPSKYLANNHIFTKDGELLVRVDPSRMTSQLTELMNENRNEKHKYKTTSLNPVNPENNPNEFEKEALHFFQKNPNNNYYFKIDEKSNFLNFMGKLIVDKNCLECHTKENYKVGDLGGGISISFNLNSFKYKEIELDSTYKLQIFLLIATGIIIYIFIFYFTNKFYEEQVTIKQLKEKYEFMYNTYELAVNSAELGLWDRNLEENTMFFSKELKKLLGYKEDEVENKLEFWHKNVHPADKDKAHEIILNNQNKLTSKYENIYRIKHKDGNWIWILDRGKTVFDKNGKAIRMIGFYTNITKIKNLEMELSKLKKVIEHSPISIVITDIKGNIEYINPNFSQITGYSFEEVIGANPRVLKSEYTSSLEYKDLWETIINNKTWIGKFKNKDKNGKEFWESAIITPILDESGQIVNFLAIKKEITKEIYLKDEIKNKEEMMIAQSRHAAMGEMISMIAHQWRQPISVIAMACNNILIDIELESIDNEQLKDSAESMLEQTKYLSQTIEDFRNFFKPDKKREIVNPKEVVEETLSIISSSLESNNINVIFEKADDCKVSIF
jgi:PAS domain S-box-containing protein